jgi:hypothetical protein
MEKSEFKDFLSIINQAAIVFDIELSKDRQAVYWDIFKEYSFNEFKDAMNQVVRTCKFFPRPVEILDFMADHKFQIEDHATNESMLVIELMQKIGGYSEPKFSDITTKIVIDRGFGGWQALCEKQLSKDNQWFIKDFVRLYRSFENNTKYLEIKEPNKQLEGG